MGYSPPTWAPYGLSLFTTIMSAILCLVAVTGNTLGCLAIFKDPLGKLRSPFAYFLVNLACSDLIVGGVMLPISVVAHMHEMNGYVPIPLLRTIHLSYFASATASILSLVALTIDRYMAVVSAIRYRVYFSWRRCVAVSCMIWIFSIGLPVIYLEIGYIDYLMFYSHSAALLALVGIVVTNVRQKVFLQHRRNSLKNIQNTSTEDARKTESRRLATEKKITKAFLLILLLFASTYIPAVTMIYLLQFCTSCSNNTIHMLRDFQFLLISGNSCMNPFVCCIRLKYYRKSIVALFPCSCWCRVNSSNAHQQSVSEEVEVSRNQRTFSISSDLTSNVRNEAQNTLLKGNEEVFEE